MDFAKAVEQSLGITDPEQQMQVFSSMLALLKLSSQIREGSGDEEH